MAILADQLGRQLVVYDCSILILDFPFYWKVLYKAAYEVKIMAD